MTDSDNLGALHVVQKSGKEPFHDRGNPLNFALLDFWQWSSSDLVNNALRGVLAEYIVKKALHITSPTRVEWDAYDFMFPNGLLVEVKSAAYVQSWSQQSYSAIKFGIRPTIGWDAGTNEYETQSRRQAHVYIFCVLHHREQSTIDPLDVSQWDFYVLPTTILDQRLGAQKTVSLFRLMQLEPVVVPFATLLSTVQKLFPSYEWAI